jgi:serine/threonine protein kinase
MEKYEFIETIAYGQKTVVYKVRDPENGNEYAMKEYTEQ